MPNDYSNTILEKIKQANLVGRGGAGFPTHLKWQRLKELGKPIGYVVCNASEGEPGVKKDLYILEHFPQMVFAGMVEAMQFLEVEEAYFNINKHYFSRVGKELQKLADSYLDRQKIKFNFFIEEPSYIGGESGAMLNAIEGKRTQPRLETVSPSLSGIFGKPVLINNVETFYDVARVAQGTFKPTRFTTISGPIPHPGVYEVANEATVKEILQLTQNWPSFNFFVQVGGSASGEVFNAEQTSTQVLTGCGAIEVYGTDAQPYDVLKRWFEFYKNETCGKCTPCREGSAQLYALLEKLEFGQPIPWPRITELVQVMEKTSFCDLGKSLAMPIHSYMKNVLNMEENSVR